MAGSTQIRMACHNGWLVLTDERVSLVPRRSLRRKPRWTVQRVAVAGVSLRHDSAGCSAALRTKAGKDLTIVWLHPSDALRLVKLLGYAPALPSPALGAGRHGDGVERSRCKGGRIEYGKDAVAFVPGFGLRRAKPWRLARERISGVSCLRLPGAAMLHDLELKTKDGQTLGVERVRPEAALRLLHLLGYVPGTLPEQPRAQREALELHFFTEEADEAAEMEKLTVQTGPHMARRRAVLRDLDELWQQQRSASMA